GGSGLRVVFLNPSSQQLGKGQIFAGVIQFALGLTKYGIAWRCGTIRANIYLVTSSLSLIKELVLLIRVFILWYCCPILGHPCFILGQGRCCILGPLLEGHRFKFVELIPRCIPDGLVAIPAVEIAFD